MFSLNQRAADLVERMAADAEALGCAASRPFGGGCVIDAGVEVPGSLEAGRLFAEACMSGLGSVALRQLEFGELIMPGVEVHVRHPVLACMASQYAGWAVSAELEPGQKTFLGMGSGPARARHRGEPLFETLEYTEPDAAAGSAPKAVLALESRAVPSRAAVAWLAERCAVAPEQVYVLVAPTASLVGSVQIAARIVETGLHKMHEIGYDMNTVLAGFGTCPLAPVAGDDLTALGWTNDTVLYGGRVWYTVEADDSQVRSAIERLPSNASPDYGSPFGELWERSGGDFYKIDPLLFSPAEVWINNVSTGKTYRAGAVEPELFRHVVGS